VGRTDRGEPKAPGGEVGELAIGGGDHGAGEYREYESRRPHVEDELWGEADMESRPAR
jgi:hypothetical protein